MIRRPPRSTPLSLHDALPISPPLPRLSRTASRAARCAGRTAAAGTSCRSEEHTSELQSLTNLVCRLLLEKKKQIQYVQSQMTRSLCPDNSDIYQRTAYLAGDH